LIYEEEKEMHMITITDAIKLKPAQWVSAVIMCVGTLAPGVLVIYTFRPDLFITLETAKLALLAMGLTLPLVLLNVFTVLPRVLEHGPTDINSNDLVDLRGHLYFYQVVGRICAGYVYRWLSFTPKKYF
jgi:hypothetical protein